MALLYSRNRSYRNTDEKQTRGRYILDYRPGSQRSPRSLQPVLWTTAVVRGSCRQDSSVSPWFTLETATKALHMSGWMYFNPIQQGFLFSCGKKFFHRTSFQLGGGGWWTIIKADAFANSYFLRAQSLKMQSRPFKML